MVDVVWLALALPLVGFLYNALIAWRLARGYAGVVAATTVGLSFVVGLLVLAGLLSLPSEARHVEVPLWTWIATGDLDVKASLLVDPLSVLMLLVVTGVGFLIHVYAVGYMRGDAGYSRFFAYMNLFVAAMLTLVLASSFLLLMVGWGGVGLCSYLLIAFWFDRPEAARAGVKAFVVNAIGDVGLLVANLLVFTTFGTLAYDAVFRAAPRALGEGSPVATAIALCLLLAAVAKSAQLPLYVWLPDAMAGPTPVSALIHAATMVTAGVYVIVRAHPIFELSPTALALVAGIGAVTAIFAASAALVKPNIKRVLAYSTVSQLGYMFLAVGVGGFVAGMFHLMTHAFFKALLFLAAGGVIHALSGEEDLRKMGGLRSRLPWVYGTFLVGALALAGFPLLSGFFSKDEILYAAFLSPRGSALWGAVALVATGLTAFYVFRAFFLAFHGERAVAAHGEAHVHAPGPVMVVPLVALAALSALGGYVQVPFPSLDLFLAPVFERYAVAHPVHPVLDATYWAIAGAAFGASALGIGLAYLAYVRGNRALWQMARGASGAQRVLMRDYGVEALYDAAIVRPLRALSGFLDRVVDDGLVDGVVNGVGGLARGLSAALRGLENGYVRSYALAVLLGAVLILAFVVRFGAMAPTLGVAP